VKRGAIWLVFIGSILVVAGVLWQAFTIAAFVRGAGQGALDAHGGGSLVVHLGELAIVVGAIVAWWGNWTAVGGAVAFLVLSVAQIAFLGDTDKEGGWVNGLHGFLALIVLLVGVAYLNWASRALGFRGSGPAAVGRDARQV
jgi:hypothetical protein